MIRWPTNRPQIHFPSKEKAPIKGLCFMPDLEVIAYTIQGTHC